MSIELYKYVVLFCYNFHTIFAELRSVTAFSFFNEITGEWSLTHNLS